MGRTILYVTNYYLDDVIRQRRPEKFISQAGQNKGKYIMDLLREGGNEVIVWSNAWTDARSFRFYKGFRSGEDSAVYYSDIIGAPVLNAYSCYVCSRRFLKRFVQEKKIDAVLFYNMRLENSKLALYAKRRFGIPILLQYEDGLTNDAHVKGIKRAVYRRMERRVLANLDGALLVNSKMRVTCPSVVIRGAIREPKTEWRDTAVGEQKVPKLLFASSLDRQRGIDVLLAALSHTSEKFELTITGRGEAEDEIRAAKDGRIRFLGYLEYEAYRKELAEADICLNVQLANHGFGGFSFPSKIFEYLSEGKLVVSSDVADAREALGDTLILYDGDDPERLAQTIDTAIAILKDDARRKEYRERIRRFVRENSMRTVAQKVNRLLDTVCGEECVE